jgi:hypothetical protein
MAIFTAIGAAIGAIGTFIGGLGAFGTFALNMAVGTGLSLVAKAISGSDEAATTDTTQPGFSVQGKLSAGGDIGRSAMFGRGMTAGSLVYTGTWGQDGDTPNAYFVQVIAVSDLPVSGLAQVWINGELVTLGATAHADYGYPVTEYAKDGKDHLWVKFYGGAQATADAYLVAKFGSSERPYQSTRVGVGVAYAVCTALVDDTLFSGFPSFKFVLDGVKLYDISKDDTAGGSGSHRWNNPATWGGDGDHLPAVQAYNILRGITYGSDWFYGLQQMTGARLPAANWIAQIDTCRAEVQGESGMEPRYRAGGEVRVGNEIASTIEQLLTSMQGRLSEIGGFYKLYCGPPGSTTFYLTDDDILSTEEQTFTPFFGLSDTINGVAATYPAPDEAWNTKSAPPLYRADLEVLAGNRRLMADVAFDMVPYARQVQDLMQTALAEAQRARRHTFHLPPAFWPVEPGDIGEWTSERNSYTTKQFRVDGVVDKGNLDVILDLTEIDPADYDYDFETDFTPVTSGPTVIIRPPAQAIVDFDAQATILYDDDGIQRRPAILLTWEGDVADVSGVQFEVRRAGDEVVVTRGRTDNLAAGSVIITQSILPVQSYDVRGRYIPSSPRDTLWSGWIPVTTLDVRYSVEEFDAAVKYQVTKLFEVIARDIAAIKARFPEIADAQARTWLEHKDIRSQLSSRSTAAFAEINEVREVATDVDAALAAYKIEANTALGQLSTSLTSTITSLTNLQYTTGEFQQQTTSQIGGLTSSVSAQGQSIASIEGWAASRYTIWTDVNGYGAGIELLNGGNQQSGITFLADRFRFAYPGVQGPTDLLTFGYVNGAARFGIRADYILIDSSVTATKMSVGSLSAITANMGTLTAGVITDATGQLMRIEPGVPRIIMSRP